MDGWNSFWEGLFSGAMLVLGSVFHMVVWVGGSLQMIFSWTPTSRWAPYQ